MTIRSWMSSIMDLIGLELFELSTLKLENLPYLTMFTLSHLQILTNEYQTIYIPIKSRMSLIMGQIDSEHIYALEFGKIAESNFVYTLATAN